VFCAIKYIIPKVFYFTALATWNSDKVERHKRYIKALSFFGVVPVYGQFRNVSKHCLACNRYYNTFEEKETDVNIALELYRQAAVDAFDTAVVLSGDSDLVPVIKAVKKDFPNKRLGVLVPPNGRAKLLKESVHFHHKIRYNHLSASLLPECVTLADGSRLDCPNSWKQ